MFRSRFFLPALILLTILLLGSTSVAAAQENSYLVQEGDTLFSIAVRHGTTPEELMRLNGLSTYTIYIGQRLILPGGNAQVAAVAPGSQSHLVQMGETLFGVATRYGTTVEAIMLANGLTDSTIYVGQSLRIPVAAQTAALAAPAASAGTGGQLLNHIVVPGDTLFGIAGRYGTTVEAIMLANGLTGTFIYAGQSLRVPGATQAAALAAPAALTGTGGRATSHTVILGDTLFSIAQRYNTTITALQSANGIVGDQIYIGQSLRVPPAVAAPLAVAGATPVRYMVQPGDTLTRIAVTHGVDVVTLSAVNGLTPGSWVYAGQQLVIPGSTTAPAQVAAAPTQPAAAPQPRQESRPAARSTPAPTRESAPARESAPPQEEAPYVPPAPSTAPPLVVRAWRADVVESNCTDEDTRAVTSVLQVSVEGRPGHPVELYAHPPQESNFIARVPAGSKPELGPFGAEFSALRAARYTVVAPGLTSADVYLDGRCFASVRIYEGTR